MLEDKQFIYYYFSNRLIAYVFWNRNFKTWTPKYAAAPRENVKNAAVCNIKCFILFLHKINMSGYLLKTIKKYKLIRTKHVKNIKRFGPILSILLCISIHK